MKRIKYLIVLFLLLCININVQALSCPNNISKDLSHIASYVKANYDVKDNSETKTLTIGNDSKDYIIPNFTFEISVYNITSDIYVTIIDENNKKSNNVYYNDTNDGTYTFTNNDFGTIYKYKIQIKSNKSTCKNQVIRTINLIKPKYNAYSEYTYCKNSTILLCQRFVTKDLGIKSNEDFLNKIKVNNDKNKPIENKISDTLNEVFKNNLTLYIILFVVVIGISVGVILYLRKRSKNAGWRL